MPLWNYHVSIACRTKDKGTKVALKARLRRLCEDKSKGNGAPRLQVPRWLHEEWKKRDHLEMALEFKDCNFNKDS